MVTSLTRQQNDLLKRIERAPGLPADMPRPRPLASDVERLRALGLIVSDADGLAITVSGLAHLRLRESTAVSASGRAIRVLHGRDESISVEYWPQQPG